MRRNHKNKTVVPINRLISSPEITSIVDYVHTESSESPLLGPKHNEIENPASFKLGLYPHQKTVVQALIDLENTRMIKVGSQEIVSNAIVLSEALGSGKTIELLALICTKPKPRAFTHYASTTDSLSDRIIFKVRHSGQSLISCNVVVVGSSVIDQWANQITKFTSLKYLIVGDQYGMKNLKKLVDENQINSYDIILLKNGTVTWNGKFSPMVNVFTSVIGTKCVARAIYDDFDTIKMPSGSNAIAALSSIYVTATSNDTSKVTRARDCPTMIDALKQIYHADLNEITGDERMFRYFNVRNDPEYVKASTSMTNIEVRKYTYVNPDDKFLHLMGVMDDNVADQLMEMINGDAINTAADTIGISSKSVADIFQRILGNKHRDYSQAIKKLKHMNACMKDIESLDVDQDHDDINTEQLTAFKNRVGKLQPHGLTYYSEVAISSLGEMITETEKDRDEAGRALDRVMSNLKEGECQICCSELSDTDVFIIKCCGIILCKDCCFMGCQIKKKYDYIAQKTHLHGSCANCKHIVIPNVDLIFVDKKFNIESLDEETMYEKHNEFVTGEIAKTADLLNVPVESVAEPLNPKHQALLDIVHGKIPSECENIPCMIKHLIEGSKDVPVEPGNNAKVLVFAGFAETLSNYAELLDSNSIEYLRLQGTYRQKTEIVDKFESDKNIKVLLINASDSCAGLNLAFATDLVFTHKIINPNVEAQVAGRIQRIGRVTNARIHYLTYTNENAI